MQVKIITDKRTPTSGQRLAGSAPFKCRPAKLTEAILALNPQKAKSVILAAPDSLWLGLNGQWQAIPISQHYSRVFAQIGMQGVSFEAGMGFIELRDFFKAFAVKQVSQIPDQLSSENTGAFFATLEMPLLRSILDNTVLSNAVHDPLVKIAKDPETSFDILEILFNSSFKNQVFNNPKVQAMYKSREKAEQTRVLAEQEILAQHPYSPVRADLLKNPALHGKVLLTLLKDADQEIQQKAAKKMEEILKDRKAESRVLAALAEEYEERVRQSAYVQEALGAINAGASYSNPIGAYTASPLWFIREAAAASPKTFFEEIIRLAKDTDKRVKAKASERLKQIARDPGTEETKLSKLMPEFEDEIRSNEKIRKLIHTAGNTADYREQLGLARHLFYFIRVALFENPRLSKAVLIELARDPDEAIRKRAITAIETILRDKPLSPVEIRTLEPGQGRRSQGLSTKPSSLTALVRYKPRRSLSGQAQAFRFPLIQVKKWLPGKTAGIDYYSAPVSPSGNFPLITAGLEKKYGHDELIANNSNIAMLRLPAKFQGKHLAVVNSRLVFDLASNRLVFVVGRNNTVIDLTKAWSKMEIVRLAVDLEANMFYLVINLPTGVKSYRERTSTIGPNNLPPFLAGDLESDYSIKDQLYLRLEISLEGEILAAGFRDALWGKGEPAFICDFSSFPFLFDPVSQAEKPAYHPISVHREGAFKDFALAMLAQHNKEAVQVLAGLPTLTRIGILSSFPDNVLFPEISRALADAGNILSKEDALEILLALPIRKVFAFIESMPELEADKLLALLSYDDNAQANWLKEIGTLTDGQKIKLLLNISDQKQLINTLVIICHTVKACENIIKEFARQGGQVNGIFETWMVKKTKAERKRLAAFLGKEAYPYEVLGLAFDASKDEIEEHYRFLARLCHPDRHPDDPQARQIFEMVTSAKNGMSAFRVSGR